MCGRRLCFFNVAVGMIVLASAAQATARPFGVFGRDCSGCHGTGGIVGTDPQNLTGEMIDVVGDFASEIPPGEFGDPDRGEGPLQAYEAAPGSSFTLTIDITTPVSIIPEAWSAELKRIERTDPDFQTGNPDSATWEDDALALIGAMLEGNGSSAIPLDETGWTIHTDLSGGPTDGWEYYTSSDLNAHDWTGPVQLVLDVFVPGGVLPGWYDIEVAVAGVDTSANGFYEDEHFYLHVIPEPATMLVLGAGALICCRRRR